MEPCRLRGLSAGVQRGSTAVPTVTALCCAHVAGTHRPRDDEVNLATEQRCSSATTRRRVVVSGPTDTLTTRMDQVNQRFYGMSPFARLATAHGASVMGDACVTVSLAGSIFFTLPGAEARPRVLLFLALTMAPFAVVAPLVGPALDRSKGGRRMVVFGAAIGRALIVFLMVGNLDNLLLYPLAFGILVLGRAHTIAKSALVPALVDDPKELVEANSRIALVSGVAGAVGGVPAAGLYALLGSRWALGLAMIVYGAAAVLSLRIPKAERSATPPTEREQAELRTPSVVFASTSMSVIRASVGFITFLLAFNLRRAGEPAWVYGAVIVVSIAGNLAGAFVAPPLRKKVREEWILAGAALVPSIVLLLAARSVSRGTILIAAFAVAIGTQCGKLSFDSLVQRDAPDAVRGRNFARFETQFQLAWVLGALVPVALNLSERLGFFVLSVILGFVGLTYLGGVRSGRDRVLPEGPSAYERGLRAVRNRFKRPR